MRPNVFDGSISEPKKVIYSCKCLGSGGFTHYALCVYRPRSPRARAVIAVWQADLRFPRHIYTRDFLNFTLRHQRRATSYERQVAAGIWHSYVGWRRAQAKVRGVCATIRTAIARLRALPGRRSGLATGRAPGPTTRSSSCLRATPTPRVPTSSRRSSTLWASDRNGKSKHRLLRVPRR